MKCDICRMPSGGVCTRPHDANAVARWMASNVEGGGYRRPDSPAPSRNVERIDEGGVVSLIVTGRAVHTVLDLPPWWGGPVPEVPTIQPVERPVVVPRDPPPPCPRHGLIVDDLEEPYCPKCAWTPELAVAR